MRLDLSNLPQRIVDLDLAYCSICGAKMSHGTTKVQCDECGGGYSFNSNLERLFIGLIVRKNELQNKINNYWHTVRKFPVVQANICMPPEIINAKHELGKVKSAIARYKKFISQA